MRIFYRFKYLLFRLLLGDVAPYNRYLSVLFGYKYEDGSPKRCKCGCTDFKETVIDSTNGIACEVEIKCKKCDRPVAYWLYGSYEM